MVNSEVPLFFFFFFFFFCLFCLFCFFFCFSFYKTKQNNQLCFSAYLEVLMKTLYVSSILIICIPFRKQEQRARFSCLLYETKFKLPRIQVIIQKNLILSSAILTNTNSN